MERKNGLNALWVLLLFLAVAFCAEATERKETIYKAYINGKMDVWKQVMTELESKSVRSPSEQLELLEYYYGYVGFLLGQDRTAQAKPYVKKGIEQIALLEKKRIQPATVLAYKGAFAGYSIALNKIKAVSLGPKVWPICLKPSKRIRRMFRQWQTMPMRSFLPLRCLGGIGIWPSNFICQQSNNWKGIKKRHPIGSICIA